MLSFAGIFPPMQQCPSLVTTFSILQAVRRASSTQGTFIAMASHCYQVVVEWLKEQVLLSMTREVRGE
jgi:hypothetical protein